MAFFLSFFYNMENKETQIKFATDLLFTLSQNMCHPM